MQQAIGTAAREASELATDRKAIHYGKMSGVALPPPAPVDRSDVDMLVRTSRGLRPRLTDVLRRRRAARRQRSERYRRSSDGRPARPSPAPL